jgi:hypothetical protein
MVVPVFIINCHVLEKLNTGPVHAQMTITPKAIIDAPGRPASRVTYVEIELNHRETLLTFGIFVVMIFYLNIPS